MTPPTKPATVTAPLTDRQTATMQAVRDAGGRLCWSKLDRRVVHSLVRRGLLRFALADNGALSSTVEIASK
jgi:hypothetical protein